MSHASIVRWMVSLCTCPHLSQRKTLVELVFGAIRCQRVSIADIGRSVESKDLPKFTPLFSGALHKKITAF